MDYVILATSLRQPFDLYFDSTAINAARVNSPLQESPRAALGAFARPPRFSSDARGGAFRPQGIVHEPREDALTTFNEWTLP